MKQDYSMYEQFERACIKDNYSSSTTRYMGHITDALKAGVISRTKILSPSAFMQTKNTTRACKGCKGTGVIMKEHYNGHCNLESHVSCNGTGEVFG